MNTMQPPVIPPNSLPQTTESGVVEEPLSKKSRIDDRWTLKAVLADVATYSLPTVAVVSAEVADPKQTSSLVRKLNEMLPLPSLQHVKRVKSVKDCDNTRIFILICLSSDFDSIGSVDQHLTDIGISKSTLAKELKQVEVAALPPTTRKQFDRLRSAPDYWPCNFHEDKYIESLVNQTHELWSVESRLRQETHMRRAITLGTSRTTQDRNDAKCVGSVVLCCAGDCGGGVVVDPATDTVIAEAHATTNLHPLQHTVFNLVDLVARSQGGGACSHTAKTHTFYYQHNVQPGNGTDATETTSSSSDKVASCTHLKRYGSVGQLSQVPKTGPYLCTGYDVYLRREPCHMCAMALVHMRTRRVFYSEPSKDGALGTNDKIHTLEGINHRFEVFSDILNTNNSDRVLDFCC